MKRTRCCGLNGVRLASLRTGGNHQIIRHRDSRRTSVLPLPGQLRKDRSSDILIFAFVTSVYLGLSDHWPLLRTKMYSLGTNFLI